MLSAGWGSIAGRVIGGNAGIDSTRRMTGHVASPHRWSEVVRRPDDPGRDPDYSGSMTAGASVEPRWPSILWDVAPVAALVAIGVATAQPERGRDVAAQFLILAPLLVRRLWPTAVLLVVGALAGLTSMETPTPWIQVGTVALASYTVGDLGGDRLRGALSALLVSAMISLALLAQDANASQAVVFPLVVLVPAWLAGDVVRQRRLDASRGPRRANRPFGRRRSGSASPWPRSAGRWPASCTTSWRTGSR